MLLGGHLVPYRISGEQSPYAVNFLFGALLGLLYALGEARAARGRARLVSSPPRGSP